MRPGNSISPIESEKSYIDATTGDWASISSGVQDGASQDNALNALKSRLASIVETDNLVILCGLGTSLGIPEEAGKKAPTMSDLWADASQLSSFASLESQLSQQHPEIFTNQNIENLLSLVQGILQFTNSSSVLQAFLEEAERMILEKCSFISENQRLETHSVFLRKIARRSTRLARTQIFTTNYDLAFEVAAQQSRFSLIDGFGFGGNIFDGGLFDIDYVRRIGKEPPVLEPSVFQLLKLHGSVSWDNNGKEIRKLSHGTMPEHPVLVYPSSEKYQRSYQQPYFELVSRLQIALRQPNTGLLIVGFGFNDAHLVAPIESAIKSNTGLNVAVVTPGARNSDRGKIFSWMESLIKLGDQRIGLFNGTFDDLVQHLPERPIHEEQGQHAERVTRALEGSED